VFYIQVAYLLYGGVVVSLVVFSEKLTRNTIRAAPMFMLGLVVGLYLYGLTNRSYFIRKSAILALYDYSEQATFLLVIALIMFIIVTGLVTQAFWFIYKYNYRQRNHVFVMIVGFFCSLLLTPIMTEFAYFLPINNKENSIIIVIMAGIIPNVLLAIGTVLLTLPYLTSQNIGFLAPQRYYKLMIINKEGLLLWDTAFEQNTEEEIDVDLFTGAVTAIQHLLREAAGITTQIKEIVYQDRLLLLSSTHQITGILIIDRRSSYVSSIFQQFVKLFQNSFDKQLQSSLLDREVFKDADTIFSDLFGTG
jgi:hypothetical protein